MRSLLSQGNRKTILATLLAGASLSAACWQFALVREDARLSRRFELHAAEAKTALEDRFRAYQQVLRGGAALFSTAGVVTRQDWHNYVSQLEVNTHYPGIQGIGFAVQLSHDSLSGHVAEVRADGFPTYQVHPLDPDRAPTAIVFLEPFDARNRRAFGFDMYSNPVRREAMARARDSGEPALSGQVTLLQETEIDPQPGTLLYFPLYRHGAARATVEERRLALMGWVYSPFRMRDLMHGILGETLADISLQVYSDPTATEPMFATNGRNSRAAPRFRRDQNIQLAGQVWRMSLASHPQFSGGLLSFANLVLMAGLLLTLAVGAVVAGLSGARRRAQSLAEEMTDSLQRTEMHQSAILRHAPTAIVTTEPDGTIRSLNPAAERLLGYAESELAGRRSLDALHDPDELMVPRPGGHGVARGLEALLVRARCGEPEESEWTYIRKDGGRVPVHLAINAMLDLDGDLDGFLAMAYDISDRVRSQACIQHLAHHDALTDLPNRVLLQDRLDQALRRARRDGTQVAVLMLDLDHFKRINDSLGHHVGDDLLLRVAQRLSSELRQVDTVARTGGDEFVIVLPGVKEVADVDQVVEQLLTALGRPMPVDRHEMIVTPSIGICLFPRDGEDPRTLLKHADTAMYQAKDAGRGGYKYFRPQMLHANERRLETESALRKALQTHQLSLAYQPQIDLLSGSLVGCEALLRWRHAELGQVSPASFVPLAEEMGLIQPIGEWVIREACRQAIELRDRLGLAIRVAVNISPRQFIRGDLVSIIRSALAESGLPPEALEIEMTEGVLVRNSAQAIDFLHRIRELGIRVAIDDFGTGYSSLSYLTRFPIDKLKIDQSFIRDLSVDANDAAVTSAIIVMAHTLHLTVIAEGVENPEQVAFLQDRGCNVAQGFYFGSPMPADEFAQAARVMQRGQASGARWLPGSAGLH